MNFINNSFNDIREINGFTKEELLEVRSTLTKFKSENTVQSEIEEYLKKRFPPEILEYYKENLREYGNFKEQYITPIDDIDLGDVKNYNYLTSVIIEELKLISNNLVNLKINARNVKRLTKNITFIEEFLTNTNNLLDENNDLISKYKNSLIKYEKLYDNYKFLWVEINKIKNLNFKLNTVPTNLENWDEIQEIYSYIESLDDISGEKKKRKKKDIIYTFHFDDIYQYYLKKQDGRIDFYTDLIYLLYQNKLFKEFEEKDDDFINIIERKEIGKKLKKFLRPHIKNLIEDEFKDIFDEILILDQQYGLDEEGRKLKISSFLEQKISAFLPKIIDHYLNGLEKKYQERINDVSESIEFKNIINFYSEKIEILASLINEVNERMLIFEPLLKPYEDILQSLKRIISNVISEIERRKDEFLYYMKTVKKERLRDNIRRFISQKISEVNDLITSYQDETSLIIREEFPQLKRIQEILKQYKEKIRNIKDEVYNKLDTFKEKDIDIYQIIKQWEDNFNRKKQQLKFLLSLLLSKLYKNFKGLIENEEMLFENISEINREKDDSDLPLNFALSAFLIDKLTEAEISERITEINSKMNSLNQEINLYQEELIKLKDYKATRVRMREGIEASRVQCTVCHEHINFAEDQIIKCPFCGSVYHYLCVVYWLGKYNSCPMCNNQFLDPNLGLFEPQD